MMSENGGQIGRRFESQPGAMQGLAIRLARAINRSLERTGKVVDEVIAAIQSNPNNQDVVSFAGFDFLGGAYKNNAATLFVAQKHWDDREVSSQQLVGELFAKTAGIKEALVLAFNPPAIFGLGNTGGF